jgi:hypothetical protein
VNARDHYNEAVKALDLGVKAFAGEIEPFEARVDRAQMHYARAQVHATLAQAVLTGDLILTLATAGEIHGPSPWVHEPPAAS